MRSCKLDVQVADGRHADEIVGTGQKRGKRGRKRNRATRRESHCRAKHDLCGDEILIEAIRMRLLEFLREGRVLDVGVQSHHTWIGVSKLRQRGSVCLETPIRVWWL